MISNAQRRRQAKFSEAKLAWKTKARGINEDAQLGGQPQLEVNANWQTRARGTNADEFQIFLACADDGNGGDITNGGAPLPTFDAWMNR